MAYIGFQPDPDYPDPLDYGYGTFIAEDGTRRYGYDPELAQSLPQAPPELEQIAKGLASLPDERQAMGDVADRYHRQMQEQERLRQGEMEDYRRERAAQDFGQPLTTRIEQLRAKPEPEPAASLGLSSEPAAPAGPLRGVLSQAPDDVRAAIEDEAQRTGLDAEKLAQIIKYESGFSTNIKSRRSDSHAGLLQFGKHLFTDEGNLGEQAGLGKVSWDEMRQMSPGQQMRLASTYLKNAGIGPDSSLGDYYTAVAAPGLVNASDETVAYAKGSKAAASNPTWDKNSDGQVTVGELRRVLGSERGQPSAAERSDANMSLGDPEMAQAMANQSLDYAGGDQLSRVGRGAAPGQPGMPGAPGVPIPPGMGPGGQGGPGAGAPQLGAMGGLGQLGGLALAGAQQRGMLLSAEQYRQRQATIHDQYSEQSDAAARATERRTAERERLMQEYRDLAVARQQDAQDRERHRQTAMVQARQEIESVVKRPLQRLDAGRYLRNMGEGKRVLGAVATLFAEFGRIIGGAGGPNVAIQRLNAAIDDDIANQREQIRAGEVNQRNRLSYWTNQLQSLEAGEAATRLEMQEAARLQAKASLLGLENADLRAGAEEFDAKLSAQRDAALTALEEDQRNRLMLDYKPTKQGMTGPLPVGPNSPIYTDPALRARLVQEFMSLSPEQQASQIKAYSNDMTNADKLERAVLDLAEAYGGRFNENGKLVPVGKHGKLDMASSATGPGWAPQNWIDTERDNVIIDAWAQIELMARMQWATEPNGEKYQALFSQIDKPKRDSQVPIYLERLWRNAKVLRSQVERSATPQTQAYVYERDHRVQGGRVPGRIDLGAAGAR